MKTITVYTFEELTAEIQEKIIEKNRDINTDYEWYDCIIEETKNELESKGFPQVEITFSGFYSQGDGASFTCNNVDLMTFIAFSKQEDKYKLLLEHIQEGTITASIYRARHHYSHNHTVRANVETQGLANDVYDTPAIQVLLNTLEEDLEETKNTLCKELYKTLEQEYDYLTDDAQIKDTLIANEYTYTADGVQV